MTDFERLKATKDFLREQHQGNLKNCKHPELKPLIIETHHENIKAFDVAISALEKQIPKKPILDCIFPSGVEWYLCPACNHNGIEKTGCYCHKCGQALDWSNTE